MRRVLTLLIVLLTVYISDAQAQKLKLNGGLNLANFAAQDENSSLDQDFEMKPGFHAGLTYEEHLFDNTSFLTGLFITQKGYRVPVIDRGRDLDAEANTRIWYLEIPLNAVVSSEMTTGSRIYGLFGPYLGIGLDADLNIAGEFQGIPFDEDTNLEFGSVEGEDTFRRFDYGLNAGFGYETGNLSIGLVLDLGLANIAADQDDGFTLNNRVLRITVGYNLSNSFK